MPSWAWTRQRRSPRPRSPRASPPAQHRRFGLGGRQQGGHAAAAGAGGGGLAAPRVFTTSADPRSASLEVSYPCVLKPTFLAASRGVIRADEPSQFAKAWERIVHILEEPAVAARGGAAAHEILVEDFVRGEEIALEGLLSGGELRVLALFDKPDPLDGPFFEETIYVTPSRRSGADAGGMRASGRGLGARPRAAGRADPRRDPGRWRTCDRHRDRRAFDRRPLLAHAAVRNRA